MAQALRRPLPETIPPRGKASGWSLETVKGCSPRRPSIRDSPARRDRLPQSANGARLGDFVTGRARGLRLPTLRAAAPLNPADCVASMRESFRITGLGLANAPLAVLVIKRAILGAPRLGAAIAQAGWRGYCGVGGALPRRRYALQEGSPGLRTTSPSLPERFRHLYLKSGRKTPLRAKNLI